MILRAMAQTGAAPQTTLMVGDTSYDMEMARNAKVHALGVAWGYHTVAQLEQAGAHAVAASCTELMAAIAAHLASGARP